TPRSELRANLQPALKWHSGIHADTALHVQLNLWPAQPGHIVCSALPQKKISPDKSNWQIRQAPWPTAARPYARNNPEFSQRMRVQQNVQSECPARETSADKIRQQKRRSVKWQEERQEWHSLRPT